MKHTILIISIFITLSFSFAAKPIEQHTEGYCSPAIADTKGNVTITCQGLSTDQITILTRIPVLLEQLLEKQIDPNEILSSLDSIKALQKEQLTQVNEIHSKQKERKLSDNQKRTVINNISKFRNSPILITSVIGDPESKQYGEQFVDLFLSAGWNVGSWNVNALEIDNKIPIVVKWFAKDPIGLWIAVTNKSSPPKPAIALKTALKSASIDAPITDKDGYKPEEQNIPPDFFELVIGRKD